MHYQCTPDDAARFWAKVDKNGPIPTRCPERGPCWLWTASTVRGYGRFQLGPRLERANRVAWLLTHGRPSADQMVLHHCDTPRCVRPDHLYLGRNVDNVRDRDRRTGHGMARLTETQVREVLRDLARGISQVSLARRLGVDPGTINHIARRKSWHWVTP